MGGYLMVILNFIIKTKVTWQKAAGMVFLAVGIFAINPIVSQAEHPPGWVATCGVFRVVYKLQQGEAEIHIVGEKGGYPIAYGNIIKKGSSDASNTASVTDYVLAQFGGKGWLVGLNTYREPKLYMSRDGQSDTICSPSIRILGE
jgi:hypothetical protein